MLRTHLSNGSRIVASTSQVVSFHTSSASLSLASKRTSARNKKKNIANTAERLKQAALDHPSVVLGTRSSEEAEKWGNCALSKVLVDEEALFSTTEMNIEQFSVGKVALPKEFGYGVTKAEQELLFQDLPDASIEMTTHVGQTATPVPGERVNSKAVGDEHKREARKANMVAKVLDLRNANAGGIAFENRRRIIEAFSTPKNPFDTGRTEVQVALLTYQIRNLWKHLLEFKRDVGNRRGLRKLVHQRARLLRYLKGHNRDRYDIVLEQLALEPEAVEGELVV